MFLLIVLISYDAIWAMGALSVPAILQSCGLYIMNGGVCFLGRDGTSRVFILAVCSLMYSSCMPVWNMQSTYFPPNSVVGICKHALLSAGSVLCCRSHSLRILHPNKKVPVVFKHFLWPLGTYSHICIDSPTCIILLGIHHLQVVSHLGVESC